MPRFKDIEWALPKDPDGTIATWQAVEIAVLMDLRDQLKELNRSMVAVRNIVTCSNAVAIPRILRHIERNTARVRCAHRGCSRSFDTVRGRDQHARLAHA